VSSRFLSVESDVLNGVGAAVVIANSAVIMIEAFIELDKIVEDDGINCLMDCRVITATFYRNLITWIRCGFVCVQFVGIKIRGRENIQ
jgi:hypothetical protein